MLRGLKEALRLQVAVFSGILNTKLQRCTEEMQHSQWRDEGAHSLPPLCWGVCGVCRCAHHNKHNVSVTTRLRGPSIKFGDNGLYRRRRICLCASVFRIQIDHFSARYTLKGDAGTWVIDPQEVTLPPDSLARPQTVLVCALVVWQGKCQKYSVSGTTRLVSPKSHLSYIDLSV